jgi:DNA polymerase-4
LRKPDTIERLYLDFDGFFASVMQQAIPALRNRPVGVLPFETDAADSTVVIACSKEAKAKGCQNVMPVPDARRICPGIVFVTQRPDLFRRAHNALLNEIACEIPIETVKSIDELTCRLDPRDRADPHDLAARIKRRIKENIGECITCSIGFAANRMLAKIACKIDKPDGVTVWHPEDMPSPLLRVPLSDIPGVGNRMHTRLLLNAIGNIEELLAACPKQLRALWRNVNGERIWYALHGYDLHAIPTGRGMYGHGRVLPPDWRDIDHARDCSRLLLTKAARRMRRDGYYANVLCLWLSAKSGSWSAQYELPCVQDDQACLSALSILWEKARLESPRKIVRLGVTLMGLVRDTARQADLFYADDTQRQRWENVTHAIDHLNVKYGKRVLMLGPWVPPPGGYAGGKISYTRIPTTEDFW